MFSVDEVKIVQHTYIECQLIWNSFLMSCQSENQEEQCSVAAPMCVAIPKLKNLN